jgi:hypothetical protein
MAWAYKRGLPVDVSYTSAVIFLNFCDNFHPESFKGIINRREWQQRTTKPHQNVAGVLEMQSSNSSDALLMNIFCHPHISDWKGVRDLLNLSAIDPVFGFKPLIAKRNSQGDSSEIDMALYDLFVEAKLTEEDFT